MEGDNLVKSITIEQDILLIKLMLFFMLDD